MSNNFNLFESDYDNSEPNLILPSLWEAHQIHNQASSMPLYVQDQNLSDKLPVRMDSINYNMYAPSLPKGFVRSFFKIDDYQDYARIVGKHYSRANLFASFCEKANVTNLTNFRNILMITTSDYPTLQWLEDKLFENLKNKKLPVYDNSLSWRKNISIEKKKVYFCWNLKNPITSIEDVTLLFKNFGKINKVRIIFDKEKNQFRNYGWVTFDKSIDAKNAVESNALPNINIEFAKD